MESKKKTGTSKAELLREIAFADGSTLKIDHEDGKYYHCEGGVQFRKSNPNIVGINVTKVSDTHLQEEQNTSEQEKTNKADDSEKSVKEEK